MKVSTPKGTRDFGPKEMAKRKFIFSTLEETFKNYGFQALETPSMENLSVLTGKYGEEGDRLIFKILNSGDYLKKAKTEILEEKNSRKLTTTISEKALRYDLTIPFARYVSQNQNDITFPFRRYQIQPVWRAERPQKGRYREFFQCDADIIGDQSLLCEVDLLALYDEAFKKLGITDFSIKLNNRKVLAAMAEIIGEKDKFTDITIAVDKLDKIGMDKVCEELKSKGISHNSTEKLVQILTLEGNNAEKLSQAKKLLEESEQGLLGIKELEYTLESTKTLGIESIDFDITLARGLDYYTGAIFEVKLKDSTSGSLGGGGRYDDLTGIFGLKNISGVGLSFGADRIYDLLSERNLFPAGIDSGLDLLILHFGEETLPSNLQTLMELRQENCRAEIYPSEAKLKKQMKYAHSRSTKFVLIRGPQELEKRLFNIKNMETGEQKEVPEKKLFSYLKQSSLL
ncbi:MAG: histidine--tRNA ligase [Bdellovibrionota bacterium]|nr:histidine--tRNA ligase [Bdellovibrionota bacterium]